MDFRSGSCVDLPLEEAYGWKRPGFLCELPEEHLSSLREISSSALTSKLSGNSKWRWHGAVRKAVQVSGFTPPCINSR